MHYDLSEHLCRHIAFSRAACGPGRRTAGIIHQIRKGLADVEEAGGTPEEWVDVVILALDGLTRSILFADGGCGETDDAAAEAAHMIREKQGINERRTAEPSFRIDLEGDEAATFAKELEASLGSPGMVLAPGRPLIFGCSCPKCVPKMDDPA